MKMNALDELSNESYTNSLIYKDNTKRCHDARLKGNKEFKVGQKVLLFNSRMKLFPGKLKTCWYGSFVVNQVFSHGAIKLIKEYGTTFKANGHRLKLYEEGMPSEEKD